MFTVNRPWHNLVAAQPATKGIKLKPLGIVIDGKRVLFSTSKPRYQFLLSFRVNCSRTKIMLRLITLDLSLCSVSLY